MSDVAERVKKIVIEHLGVEADKVVEGANFIDDLGADSLDTVELVMAFEEEFGVEIPDDKAETIVVCPSSPREQFLRAACLAGSLGAPLWLSRDGKGESKEIAAEMLRRRPVA